MSTYCEGSDCSKRYNCKLHNPGEGTHEYIDWSIYGSGTFIKDTNGNYQAVIEHSCGDQGNFKHYVPVKEFTKEEKLLEDINDIFRRYYNETFSSTELKLMEPLKQAERFIINELWHEVKLVVEQFNKKDS